MLQLGDKGARQSKKNFNQAGPSLRLDNDRRPRTTILSIQTGRWRTHDAWIPAIGVFCGLKFEKPGWIKHYRAIFTDR
jgi:hypothetical protein